MAKKARLAAIILAMSAFAVGGLLTAGCGDKGANQNGQPIQPGDYTKEPGQAPAGTKK